MGTSRRAVDDDLRTGRRYTLVVATANPASVEQLMRTATDLARDRDGLIRVVSVIHKPVTSPFRLFAESQIKREFAGDQEAVLDRAVSVAEAADVPTERNVRVGSDVSDALLAEVRDAGADALLLGWQERPRASDVVLGATVDPVVRRAPCDVFVERIGTTADGVDAILVPTDGGAHVEPATDLAGAVARANDATVRIVSYVSPDADEGEVAEARENVRVAADQLRAGADTDVREAADVADAIVSAAADHDFVVLGATREHRLRNRVVGSVAASVAQRADPPIVIARRRERRSLVERTLGRLW